MQTNKKTFITIFIQSSLNPVAAFKNRNYLNWGKILFLVLFLNALSVIPVTVHFANIESYPVETLYPSAFKLLSKEAVLDLPDINVKEGQLQNGEPYLSETEKGAIRIAPKENKLKDETDMNGIKFQQNGVILAEEDLPQSFIPYSGKFVKGEETTAEEIKEWLSSEWMKKNKPLVVGFFSFVIGGLLLMSFLFVSGMTSLILYLSGKSKNRSFQHYKEAVHVTLHALFLPTIISFIISLFYFDPFVSLTIQSGGLCLLLLFIFFRTNFMDRKELLPTGN